MSYTKIFILIEHGSEFKLTFPHAPLYSGVSLISFLLNVLLINIEHPINSNFVLHIISSFHHISHGQASINTSRKATLLITVCMYKASHSKYTISVQA
ncbi:hypothetical protein PNOK_0935200 [Pyrrhoderma noxium]|uniref:Uncharacterized protein n=1 Tax=Pyrrhoderma noxium TaxID=2282107 RepID=A0A286U5L4_9AGAM|nr:hypothetical protein PNOK_0935200 [Pyrrhoderma noxium]